MPPPEAVPSLLPAPLRAVFMSGETRGHSALGTIGPMSRPVITFLTDFGPSAPAVCRGVMYGICPDAIVIDISHQVPRYSIREGSDTLVFALPYMPIGIHVAVVDPGVGTERLPVAIVARGDILIGPDNGLLTQADALGGIEEARAISIAC
jgi:S-adenosylmethionine hydrolase